MLPAMPSDAGSPSAGPTVDPAGAEAPDEGSGPSADTPSDPATPRRGRAQRLAGLLPAPRDEGLIEIGRAVRDFVRGRVPQSTLNARRADLEEERRRLEHGRARLAEGDPAGALDEVATVERLRPGGKPAATLRLAADRSGAIRGRQARRPAAIPEVLAAIEHLRRLDFAQPTVVLYHQPSPDNPFQALLYRRAWDRGIAPVPLWDLQDLDAIPAAVPAGTRLVLHLHWVNRVLHGASGPDEATTRLATFEARLRRAVAAGVTVVWTAHNVLPHDTPFEEADTKLRRIIVEQATMIHVLAASTPELAAPLYRIPPEKVVHVPLPTFRGAYADVVDRPAARFALGLPADAYVLALVGGLRPHKGLHSLLDAFELAATDEPRLRLLIAGSPSRGEAIEAFLARAARDPRISLHARPIPSDDMQLFLRAADVAMLPYLRTLNSAVLMMVLAFDLPVIAPAVGGIGETIEPAMSVSFEPGDARSLAAAILAARDLPPDGVRAAARRISEAHAADTISDRFLSALHDALEPAPASGR